MWRGGHVILLLHLLLLTHLPSPPPNNPHSHLHSALPMRRLSPRCSLLASLTS